MVLGHAKMDDDDFKNLLAVDICPDRICVNLCVHWFIIIINNNNFKQVSQNQVDHWSMWKLYANRSDPVMGSQFTYLIANDWLSGLSLLWKKPKLMDSNKLHFKVNRKEKNSTPFMEFYNQNRNWRLPKKCHYESCFLELFE